MSFIKGKTSYVAKRKLCAICTREFVANSGAHKFCDNCREPKCAWCGKQLGRRYNFRNQNKYFVCSNACHMKMEHHRIGREESNQKISKTLMGHDCSEERRHKMSINHLGINTGEKHPNWLGGKSFEKYGRKFNKYLKEEVRERDQHRCQECFRHQDELYDKNGKKYSLIVHHIDYNKKNNLLDNLISLCRSCHCQTNFKREDWQKYFSNKLRLVV